VHFGVVTAKIDEIGYISHAENLGFTHCWVTDEASCLAGPPEAIVERLRALEQQGLSQIMLYPPLNRQYRVIEDFAERVMARL